MTERWRVSTPSRNGGLRLHAERISNGLLGAEMRDSVYCEHDPSIGQPISPVNGSTDKNIGQSAPMGENDTFGERVRSLRISHGLSQIQLAKKVKIGQSSISDLEKPNSNPHELRARTLTLLAKALGTNPGFLINGKDTPVEPTVLSVDESELIGVYRALSPTAKKLLLGSARGALDADSTAPSKAKPYAKVKA